MIGTGLIDDETEMRQLIEQSLLNKSIQEEQQNGSPVKSNHAHKDAREFDQQSAKPHYESSASYFMHERSLLTPKNYRCIRFRSNVQLD